MPEEAPGGMAVPAGVQKHDAGARDVGSYTFRFARAFPQVRRGGGERDSVRRPESLVPISGSTPARGVALREARLAVAD